MGLSQLESHAWALGVLVGRTLGGQLLGCTGRQAWSQGGQQICGCLTGVPCRHC